MSPIIRKRSAAWSLSLGLALLAGAGLTGLAADISHADAAPLPVAQQPDRDTFRQNMREDRQARIAGRLAYLQSRLNITPAQQPVWNAFAETARQNAEARQAHLADRPDSNAALGLIERLEQQKKMLAEETARLNASEERAKALYAVLSDEQKRLADALLLPPENMRMGMMMRRQPMGPMGPMRGAGRRPFGPPPFPG